MGSFGKLRYALLLLLLALFFVLHSAVEVTRLSDNEDIEEDIGLASSNGDDEDLDESDELTDSADSGESYDLEEDSEDAEDSEDPEDLDDIEDLDDMDEEIEEEGEEGDGEEGDGEEDGAEEEEEEEEEGEEESEQDDDEEEDEEEDGGKLKADGDIVILTSKSFQSAIDSHHAIMVEFYAKWCGHCKKLEPEYRKAAAILKSDNVTLAKIDGSKATDISGQFGVEGFPTIYFFLKGNPTQYSAGRKSADIVDWVQKKMGPPAVTVTDKNEAEKILAEKKVIGIGYFSKLEGTEYEVYQSVALGEEDMFFVQTTDAHIAKLFSPEITSPPTLAIVKEKEEKFVKFEGTFVEEEVSTFLKVNKLPLVITFTQDTSQQIFGKGIKKQLLLFAHTEPFQELRPVYEEVAREYKNIIFVHINSSDEETSGSILDYFGVDAKVAMVMGYESEGDGKKFLMKGPVTRDALHSFSKDFSEDKLAPFLKSDPPPEENNGNVTVVVGTTVDQIVFDDSKDVLLEVYAPWCSHCKALAKTYEKLGSRFSTVDSVVIAKMDGTTNEHGKIKADGFPTLLFFAAGNKSDPIAIEKSRTLKGLTKFLKKNCNIPFTLPESEEDAKKEKLAEEAAEERELKAEESTQKEGEGEGEDASGGKDEL